MAKFRLSGFQRFRAAPEKWIGIRLRHAAIIPAVAGSERQFKRPIATPGPELRCHLGFVCVIGYRKRPRWTGGAEEAQFEIAVDHIILPGVFAQGA